MCSDDAALERSSRVGEAAVVALSAAAEIVAAPRIRRLGRGDLPAVERHLLALGPADRRKRFLSPADDDAIARYVSRLDPGRAVLVGAAGPDGRLAGIAEAHPVVDAPRAVEVAVSVHPYHRREGLGRRLVGRALLLAFAGGAEAAVFHFAPENRALAGLAGTLGARFPAPGRALLLARALRADDGGAPDATAGALELAA
jgi:ribosomal protein S18 acetylase RimI-like enzyme